MLTKHKRLKMKAKPELKALFVYFYCIFSGFLLLIQYAGKAYKKHILLKLNNIFTQFIHYLFNWFVPDQDIFHVEIVSGIIHWQGRHIY